MIRMGDSDMFEVGSYVVYGTNGPCKVGDITHLDIPGCDRGRMYYVLQPVGSSNGTIYSPVDNPKVPMRELITQETAVSLLKEAKDIEPLEIDNEKLREDSYKDVLRSADCRRSIGMIRMLVNRRKERLAQGRKFTSVDERYLSEILQKFSAELSIVLNEEADKIAEQLEKELV